MPHLVDRARSLFLSMALVVGQEGLENTTLPAAEPPSPNSVPTQREDNKLEIKIERDFETKDIYQLIGGLKSVIDSVDRHFRLEQGSLEELKEWQENRSAYFKYAQEAEDAMQDSPSKEIIQVYGKALTLNENSLQLYLSSISRVEKQQEARADNQMPAIFGIYDREKFIGARRAAGALGTLLEGEFNNRDKPITNLQRSLIENLKKWSKIEEPDQFDREIGAPVVDSVVRSLIDLNKKSQSGELSNSRTKIQDFLKQAAGIDLSKAEQTRIERNDKERGTASEWYEIWNNRVSQDKTIRLAQGGKEGSQVNKLGDILKEPEGLAIVQSGAKQYRDLLSSHNDSEKYNQLIISLEIVIKANDIDDLNEMHSDGRENYTFEDLKEVLRVMQTAKQAYDTINSTK